MKKLLFFVCVAFCLFPVIDAAQGIRRQIAPVSSEERLNRLLEIAKRQEEIEQMPEIYGTEFEDESERLYSESADHLGALRKIYGTNNQMLQGIVDRISKARISIIDKIWIEETEFTRQALEQEAEEEEKPEQQEDDDFWEFEHLILDEDVKESR